MKRILTIAGALFMAYSAIAQAPERMTYQAVVRDAQNEIVANQGVTFEVSISQTTATGTVVFEESHSPITNINGLFTVVLGTGIPVTGSLSAIDWSQGPYFLNSTVKTAGSIIQGSTQLVSVPYSFYAESAGSIANIDVYLQNNAYFDTAVTNVVNNLGISNPVVGGTVINDSLILTLNDGTTINAGLAQGPQGPAGADGQDGAQGPQGLPGAQGPAGADGQDGAQGPQGVAGPQGPAGQDGAQGPQGVAGPQGSAGADGQDGSQGPQGVAGPQGPAGADGQDGAQGPQGIQGPAGADGADGQDGAQGPQGVPGPQGPAGADGLSAYEIWLNQGYIGTEQDFLNSISSSQITIDSISPNADTLFLSNGQIFIGSTGNSNSNPVIGNPLFTQGNGVIDIDGNQYCSIIIGSQEWMCDNLNTSHYSNGDTIINWEFYNLNSGYEGAYGRLYTRNNANSNNNVCPVGWHVPTKAEYEYLHAYLGGQNVAGGKMKSVGVTFWATPNTGATNVSGFNGLPGGANSLSIGCCTGGTSAVNNYGNWWTTTTQATVTTSGFQTTGQVYMTLSYNNSSSSFVVTPGPTNQKSSIRCIRD